MTTTATDRKATTMLTSRILSAHKAACLAHAMINAIENLRDSDNPDWTLATHADQVDAIAEGYLWDGVVTCICHRSR